MQLAFWGPNNSPDHQKKIFTKKNKKNTKKSEKSFQSGPNLKSFAFNREGRVDLRAPKAIASFACCSWGHKKLSFENLIFIK